MNRSMSSRMGEFASIYRAIPHDSDRSLPSSKALDLGGARWLQRTAADLRKPSPQTLCDCLASCGRKHDQEELPRSSRTSLRGNSLRCCAPSIKTALTKTSGTPTHF